MYPVHVILSSGTGRSGIFVKKTLTKRVVRLYSAYSFADVAELADAQASGA